MNNVSKDVVNSIFSEYKEEFSNNVNEDKIFEYFTIENYFKTLNLSSDEIEEGLVDSQNDWGIDGIYIFIDNLLVNDFSVDNFNPKTISKNVEIFVHIFQIKNQDKIQEMVPLKFQQFGHYLFGDMSDENSLVFPDSMADNIKERVHFFRNLTVRLASKFPKVTIKFHHVTRANESSVSSGYNDKSKAVFDMLEKDTFTPLTLEHDIIGNNTLYSLAEKTIPKSGSLIFNNMLNAPAYSDTKNGYVVTAYLKDYFSFITTKSTDENDYLLNEEMFESNIRDYQNRTSVNADIENTLNSSQKYTDFWWLNNGITILASEGNIVSKTLNLENVQIVNGLQTSNSIFNIFKNADSEAISKDDRSILVKVITLDDMDETRDEIIRATNSQNPVTVSQLRSSDPFQRKIELFLKSKDIFYDRKKNYYKNQNKPRAQIFSINYLAQAIVSIIDRNPVKARSNPTILIKKDEDYKKVFNQNYEISIFYHAIAIRNQVSEYLKFIKKNYANDPVLLNISKYYELHVTRALASLITNSQEITPNILGHLKESDIKKIPDEKILQAINIVRKAIENNQTDLSKKAFVNTNIDNEIEIYLQNNHLNHESN